MSDPASEVLEKRLGYRFKASGLLTEALQHRSFVQENPRPGRRDNERLEFLGDAVLALVTSQILMERFPDLLEGDLSRFRAQLVNASHLAHVARNLGLGPALRLGRGEELSGGREKDSILAGAVEALMAAVYLDGGLDAVHEMIENHMTGAAALPPAGGIAADCKSRLQEAFPGSGPDAPLYAVIGETGPGHDKTFTVRVAVGRWTAEGSGRSKKAAEQEAARRLLAQLTGKSKTDRDDAGG